MVMSITFALQQKHQDEQNSLCKAVELLTQSPGCIQVLNGPRTPGFSSPRGGQRISQEEVHCNEQEGVHNCILAATHMAARGRLR